MTTTTGAEAPDQMTGWLNRSLDQARELITRAETEGREFTEEEAAEHGRLLDRAGSLREQIQRERSLRDIGPHNQRLIAAVSGGSATETRDEYGSEARLNAAPNLMLTRDQVGTLHQAYLTRDVSSLTAPQAAVGQYLTADAYAVLRDAFRVASLIPTVSTEHPSITYYVGDDASAAKVVGEGGQKPESDPSYTAVTEATRKIAHFIDVTEEALTDAVGFQDMLEGELLMGLLAEENRNIISGNGAAVVGTGGTDMVGLLNRSGILTYAPAGAEARILSIAKGQTLLQAGSSFASPDTVIIHPTDFGLVRTYTSTANEFASGYALGGDAQSTTVWGMKAYVTTQIAAGTALVGNLAQAAKLHVRMAPTIKVDPYSRSSENVVRFIAEQRLALAVPRPSALLKITFNGTV